MGYIHAENFTRIGRVDSDGYIYSEGFERLGRIDKDGRIYGENFNYVGRIDSDGFIYLSNMKRIGRVHRDGYVYDELFNRVGNLDQDIVDYIFGKQTSSYSNSNSNSSYSSNSRNSSGSGITAAGCLATFTSIFAGIAASRALSSFGLGLIVFFVVYTLVCCLVDGFKEHVWDLILCVIFVAVVLFFMSL